MYTSNTPDCPSKKPWSMPISVLSKYLFTTARQPHTTIHDLPPELLEQIFTYYTCEASQASKQTLPASDIISAHPQRLINPLILGQVCSQWMAISRTRPSLWSSIYVTEPSTKQFDMAAYWLSLSGNSPLMLSLTMAHAASTPTPSAPTHTHAITDNHKPDAARRFVDLFLSHYDQWQDITIHLSHTNYLSSLQLEGRLPDYSPAMLRHLDVDYGNRMMGDGPVDDAIVELYSSPGIDSLAWSAQWYKPTKLTSIFPHWANLKRLTYRQGYSANALTVNEAVGLLTACPMLEHFDAIVYAEHGHVWDVQEVLTHSHLRVLDVTLHPDRSAVFFDSLCLPALEEVSVDFASVEAFGVMESAEPFLGLLERSLCRIKKLSFNNYGGPDDVLFEVLGSHHLRDLRILQLAGVRSGRTMDLLTRKDDQPSSLSILPNIERLEFEKSMYGEQPSTEAVERMLVSRTKKGNVGVRKVEDHGQLSALGHVELSLGALGMWGYYRLAKLASWENRVILTNDTCLPQFIQVVRGMWDWVSPDTRFPWEH